MTNLEEIRNESDPASEGASLTHLQYIFEGYRDRVIGNNRVRPDPNALDPDKYHPGGARDHSYKKGIEWAERDLASK